jgi:hypothetical protein
MFMVWLGLRLEGLFKNRAFFIHICYLEPWNSVKLEGQFRFFKFYTACIWNVIELIDIFKIHLTGKFKMFHK